MPKTLSERYCYKWANYCTIHSDFQQALLTCRRPRSQHLVETLPAALPSPSPPGSSVQWRSDAPSDVFAANVTVVKCSASATWLPPIIHAYLAYFWGRQLSRHNIRGTRTPCQMLLPIWKPATPGNLTTVSLCLAERKYAEYSVCICLTRKNVSVLPGGRVSSTIHTVGTMRIVWLKGVCAPEIAIAGARVVQLKSKYCTITRYSI